MGFHGVLGSKSFCVSEARILKMIPKCLVLNIGLKTAVCDVLEVGLGKFKAGAGADGGAQHGGRPGWGIPGAACPGHGPVGGT